MVGEAKVGKKENFDIEKEIESILKIVEKTKKYYLLQTNINDREDLSQELDILLYQKLKIYLQSKKNKSLIEYIRENEK